MAARTLAFPAGWALLLAGWCMAAVGGCSTGTGGASAGGPDWWTPSGPEAGQPKTDFFGAPVPEPKPAPKPEPSGNLLTNLFTPGPDQDAEEANYTILLTICRGPGSHVEQAKYYKTSTEKLTGWKGLFVIHKDTYSTLYWGRYRTIADAQPNLKKAKAFMTPAKVKVFARAIVVPMPGTENPGPPEWDLARTPEEYKYTVLRASFYDVPEADYVGRKKFAVEYCRQLRQQGVEAYYKHDPTQSIVTIGLFKKDALALVHSGSQYRQTVRDPRITAIFRKFPCLAVNGRQKLMPSVDAKTGKVVKVPVATYLIRIPREKTSYEDILWVPQSSPGHAKPGKAPGDAGGPAAPAAGPGKPPGPSRP